MNIPAIGQTFQVSFVNHPDTFTGKIIAVDNAPANSDRQYKIEQTKRIRKDAIGRPYTLPNSVIEVERLWFDTELTGRKIKVN